MSRDDHHTELSMRRPFVGPDGAAGCHNTLYDRQQCIGITSIHQLYVAHLVHWIVDSKHPPLFVMELVSAVVLGLHHDTLVDLYDLADAS